MSQSAPEMPMKTEVNHGSNCLSNTSLLFANQKTVSTASDLGSTMLRITQIQINYRLKIPVALRAPYAVVVKRCHHIELNTDPHTLLQIHHKKTKMLLNIVHYCDNHQVSITCNNITISSNIHLCVELKKILFQLNNSIVLLFICSSSYTDRRFRLNNWE